MPCAGLIVNDGKDLAIETADRIEARLTEAGWDVVRASSSGGMVGFANPDQSLRLLGLCGLRAARLHLSDGCGDRAGR